MLLTARYFAEVDELWVRVQLVASSVISVLVTLVLPRIEVAAETGRRHGTRLHAVFQRLELAEQLRTARDVEPLVDTDDLHYNRQTRSPAVAGMND